MANKSQSSLPSSSNATSSPSYNPMMNIYSSSAAVSNALNQRAGRGGRGRGRGMSTAQRQNLNNKVTFAKDFGTAFGKNLGSTALEMGKSVARSPFRVASSLAELPKVYKSGGAKTSDPYNIPGLGQIKTYAREAQDKIKAGDGSKLTTASTILGTGGQAMLDTAALGGLAQGAYNQVINPKGNTTALSNTIRKVSPSAGAKWDQLTYRMYKGAPQGWQVRLVDKFNLPFWKINPNL